MKTAIRSHRRAAPAPVPARPVAEWALSAAVLLAACSGSTPTGTNSNPPPSSSDPARIQVTVTTDGNGTDANGYTITVDGGSKPVAANGTVTFDSLSAGSHHVAFSGNDGHCYLLGVRQQTVTLNAGQTQPLVINVRCYLHPIGFDMDNGNQIHNIAIVDDDGSNATTFGAGSVDIDPLWSPDGSMVAYGAGNATTDSWDMMLTLAEPAGGAATSVGIRARPRSWSADGSKLLVIGNTNYGILDAASGAVTTLGAAPDFSAASFSPNGAKLTYGGFDGTVETVWVGNADGSNMTQIAGGNGRDYTCPIWSGDSSELYCEVYVIGQAGEQMIALKADGSGERTLVSQAQIAAVTGGLEVDVVQPVAIMPDHVHVLIQITMGTDLKQRASLFTMAPDGSGLADLTRAPTLSSDFGVDQTDARMWSADGRFVFTRQECSATYSCTTSIWVVNQDGSGLRKVYTVPNAPEGGGDAQWVQ